MEQRQHSKNRIAWSNVCPRKHRFSFAEEVGMGEHDAFGIGRGARRIEKGGEIVWLPCHWSETLAPLGEDAVEIGSRKCGDSRPRLSFGAQPRIGQYQFNLRIRNGIVSSFQMLVITNQQGTTAVFEELRYLICVISRIEGDRSAAGGNDAQIRGHPPWMIVGKDRDPRTWLNPMCN